jgi:amino acid adenylation domain-containing protein
VIAAVPPRGEDTQLCHQRFEAVALQTPNAPAVVFGDETMTYGDLDYRASHLARRLISLGAGPDAVVAILVERSIDVPTCVLGTWKAGAAYLPLDPESPRGRLRTVLAEVRPVAVLTQARLRHRVDDAVPVVVVDRSASPDAGITGHRTAPVRPAKPYPDNLAYVIYTSGSTGAAKGIGTSHRSLLAAVAGWESLYGLRDRVRTHLQAAGFGFDVATGDLARALLTGGCLILVSRETLLSPADLHATMRDTNADFVELTPTLLRPLVRHLIETGKRLDFVRILVAGGERWAAADYRTLRQVTGPGPRIFNTYGLSEATIDSTYFEAVADKYADEYADETVPIGRPQPGVQVAVMDRHLCPVVDGEPGELCVAGPLLARGYHGDPARTAERFVPDPNGAPGARLYRSGDLVRQLPSGELVHLGRMDDQVKVRGIRVQPAEVENALLRHPRVQAAVVVADEWSGRTELAAYAVPVIDAEPVTGEELRRFLADLLPAAMVPRFVSLMDTLPLTPNGKVDRRRLPAPSEQDQVAGLAARTPEEAALARIWAETLGLPAVGVDQDFFSLGGNSLLAAQVVMRARSELDVQLGTGVLFEHPTIAELARIAASRLPDAVPAICADPERREAPLAPGQNRLWLLHQLQPNMSAYHIPVAVRIDGSLRVAVLRAAIGRLVQRHDALRTAFVTTQGGPVQRIRSNCSVDLDIVDLRDHRPEERAAAAGTLAAEHARRPFDLAAPPLLRSMLLRLADDEHHLVLTVHHIVFDGWSLRLLLTELGAIYSALVAGREPELPALPFRYADLAAWHADRLRRGEFTDQLAYWRAQLANPPLPVELPGASTSTATTTATAAAGEPRRRTAMLDPDLSQALGGLAREQRTTLFVILLAAFATLLHRWSRRADLVVGVPFGDRNLPGTDHLVGFLVNTVGLRIRLDGDPSFAEVVRRTRTVVAGSSPNQDVPFDVVHHELGRSGGAGGLFRTWFNLLGAPDPAPAMIGLATAVLDPPVAGALFDVNVYVTELPDQLRVDLVHDMARFDAAHAGELLDQYLLLLEQIVREPDRPVTGHSLVTLAARRVLPLDDERLPAVAPGKSVPAAVLDWAERTPRQIAISAPDGDVTYANLAAWAGGIATRLRERGVGQGDVVAVRMPRSASLIATLLGVLGARAAFWVLDPAYPANRLAAQLQVVKPAAVEVAGRWETEGGGTLDAAGDPADLAYVAFTSGSTGRPVAVLGDQGPVTHFLDWYATRFGIGTQDRFCVLSGLSHDPLLRDVFAPLWTGATVCVPPAHVVRSPHELLEWLAAERVSIVHLTPPLARLIAAAAAAGGPPPVRLPDVRLVAFGGDVLHQGEVAAIRAIVPHARMVNLYGTTETPQAMSWAEIPSADSDERAGGPVPVGRGIDGVQLLVQNASGGRAGIGEPGRIVVRTPFLTRGYLDPVSSAARFRSDPWPGHQRYDTGDIGRYLPDGQVVVLARDDDQVKVAGIRVELGEIDGWLRRHPAVRDCVTVSRPGPAGEARLVSYVVPAAGESVSRARLRADLCRELPDHLLPAVIVPLESLPLTPNGKVDRAALPAPARPGHGPVVVDAPRSPLESVVAGACREILDVDPVDPESSFFDLGCSSLLMARLQLELQRTLRREIPILTLFEYPTVRALAGHLQDTRPAYTAHPRRRESPKPVSPDAHLRLAVRRAIRQEDTR